MKAIETNALIPDDRVLTLQLPQDVQPGEHHIFVIIGELPLQKSTPIAKPKQTKAEIHAAIMAYATQHAGTDMDIDYELEEAGIEFLNANEEKTS
jgi:hypothetical protein